LRRLKQRRKKLKGFNPCRWIDFQIYTNLKRAGLTAGPFSFPLKNMLETIKHGLLDDIDLLGFGTDKSKVAIIDADSLLYYCCSEDKEELKFEEAKLKLDRYMFELLSACETPFYTAVLSPHFTFRKNIGKAKIYKGNREGRQTLPVMYGLRAYAKQEWNFHEVTFLEADDVVCIYYNQNPENSIICSPDKDVIRQMEGTHYNYGKQDMVTVTKEEAWRFLWIQAIAGDSVDNIPGIPGIGPVKAEKGLEGINPANYPVRSLQMYIEHKNFSFQTAIERYKETFDLVYILKDKEDLDRHGLEVPGIVICDIRTLYDASSTSENSN
jgi:hypothetical protein